MISFIGEFGTELKLIWMRLRADERSMLRSIIIFSCFLLSTLIGLVYEGNISFQGWQIVLWLILIFLVVAFMTPAGKIPLQFNRTWLWVGLVMLGAFIVRVIALEEIPGGFHVDESGMAEFSLLHVFPQEADHTINPFRTASGSHPILYYYILRLTTFIGGYSVSVERISSVLAGTLAVPALYFMVRQFANKRTALIAAVILAGYHYHVQWSRIALNNIWVTLLMPLTIGFFMWGWRERYAVGALLSGLFLGLSAYFYQGGSLVILLMLYLFFGFWRTGEDRGALADYSLRTFAAAWVVAAPLIMFAMLNYHDYSSRAADIFGWSPIAIEIESGSADAVLLHAWRQFIHSFGAYNFYPDRTGFYAPQKPFLLGAASPVFVIGLFWTMYKKHWLPALWVLLVTFFGGFLLSAPPGSSHYVVVIPAICWLLAVVIDLLVEHGWPRWAYLLLAVIVLTDLFFYFGIYTANPSHDFQLPFPTVLPYTE